VLGHWFPPVALVLGLLAIMGTTHAVRVLLRRAPGPNLAAR
jgi:hypothetical protein